MSATNSLNNSGGLNEVHGRIINTTAVSYNLPSDETEWSRLNSQHRYIVTAMQGLYPCPQTVDSMLEGKGTESPIQVLDAGCGTGVWAIEFARRHPNSQVLGIDLSPVPLDPSFYPPNVTFKQENINDGLLDYRDQFDIIHLRCVVSGVMDMDISLQQLEECLKPNGIMIVVIPDWCSDETRQRYMKLAKIDGDDETDGVSKRGSWFNRLLYESEDRARIDGSIHAVDLTLYDRACWEHELCDPKNTISGGYWIPVGDWIDEFEENKKLGEAGKLFQENLLEICPAYTPRIASGGLDREKVEEWVANAQKEVRTMQPKMWDRFRFYITQRRADPTLQASSLSALSESIIPPSDPTLEIYRTREEALTALEKRMSTLGTFPRSAVSRALEELVGRLA